MKKVLIFRVGGDSLEGCWKLAGDNIPGHGDPYDFAPAGATETGNTSLAVFLKDFNSVL
jgi:hypothetical protein